MAKTKTTKNIAAAPVGAQQAYDKFLPAARELDVVHSYRGDAQLAYHNVDRGLDAIAPYIDVIKDELPTISVKKLQEIGNIALAVGFAVAQVDRSADGATPVLLAKARELRDVMLTSADALAKSSILPPREVARIRSGNGLIDAAQDCVDLAALFTKHAKATKGKTAINAAQIKEAAAVGTDLLKRLKRKGTKTKAQPGVTDAVEARDRLWTLLVLRHRDLRRVGMWIWADDVDDHVPALLSRAAPAKAKKPAEKSGGSDAKKGGAEKASGQEVGNG